MKEVISALPPKLPADYLAAIDGLIEGAWFAGKPLVLRRLSRKPGTTLPLAETYLSDPVGPPTWRLWLNWASELKLLF